MKRNHENPVVSVKSVLHPVSVMGVNIHEGHPQSLFEKLDHRDGNVIYIAEPLGMIPAGMMKPSDRVEGDLYFAARNLPRP